MRNIGKERCALAEQIAELETMRLSSRIAAYGGERVSASAKGDIMGEQLVKLDEMLEYYNSLLSELMDL